MRLLMAATAALMLSGIPASFAADEETCEQKEKACLELCGGAKECLGQVPSCEATGIYRALTTSQCANARREKEKDEQKK